MAPTTTTTVDNTDATTCTKKHMSSSSSSSKKKKKHKSYGTAFPDDCEASHHRSKKEQQFEQERRARFQKLLYQATRALHKEAKIIKSFECQKIVRKLKQNPRCETNQKRLEWIKGWALDPLVRLGLERLGVFHLDPSSSSSGGSSSSIGGNRRQEEAQPESGLTMDDCKMSTEKSDPQEAEFMERMVQHKRFQSAMEIWNGKVTEYQKWVMQRQEYLSADGSETRIKAQKTDRKSTSVHSSGGTGLFVCLGAASMMEDENDDDVAEGEHGYDEEEEDEYAAVVQNKKKKKNRRGQRARKAKAMAIQARREGRTWDSSVNWREKKKEMHEEEETTTAESLKETAGVAGMGRTWKQEGNEHPSWAARQKQKTGIVAFAGKKITFD